MGSANYRRIYAKEYGITWDSQKYDVHHIDLNHNNNEIKNLVLLPKKLHQQYHFWLKTILSVKRTEELYLINSNTYSTNGLEEFAKVKQAAGEFYRMIYMYHSFEKGVDMDCIVKALSKELYKKYCEGK